MSALNYMKSTVGIAALILLPFVARAQTTQETADWIKKKMETKGFVKIIRDHYSTKIQDITCALSDQYLHIIIRYEEKERVLNPQWIRRGVKSWSIDLTKLDTTDFSMLRTNGNYVKYTHDYIDGEVYTDRMLVRDPELAYFSVVLLYFDDQMEPMIWDRMEKALKHYCRVMNVRVEKQEAF
ncbi:hypothetical protein ACWKWU_08560 [Chitinophaga lutea]